MKLFKSFVKQGEEQDYNPTTLEIPSFLLSAPFYISANEPNNVWMKEYDKEKGKIDVSKAMRQWLEMYNFVAANSLTYVLPSTPGLQDQVYTANLGIVLPHLNNKEVVLSNFRSPPRVKEYEPGKAFFELMGYKVNQAPQFFEGEADLKWLNKNIYLGATGIRTDQAALDWFEKQFDMTILPVYMDDEYLYHLDCMVFPLDREKVMLAVDFIEPSTIKEIEKHVEIVDVSEESAYCGITNCVKMGGAIMCASNIQEMKATDKDYDDERYKVDELQKICIKHGYEPIFFNLSEMYKSGAMLSCCFMHLNYNNY